VAVDKQADVGLLTGGDAVAGQVDQVGAAPRGERAPGRGGEVGVLPPSVGDHVGQVDVQQLGGGRAGLADRSLAGQRCGVGVRLDAHLVRRTRPGVLDAHRARRAGVRLGLRAWRGRWPHAVTEVPDGGYGGDAPGGQCAGPVLVIMVSDR
jgi:hypothetical protein